MSEKQAQKTNRKKPPNRNMWRYRVLIHTGVADFNDAFYWCNSHEREATAIINGKVQCDPNLSGNLAPCHVVDLTGQAELVKESDNG